MRPAWATEVRVADLKGYKSFLWLHCTAISTRALLQQQNQIHFFKALWSYTALNDLWNLSRKEALWTFGGGTSSHYKEQVLPQDNLTTKDQLVLQARMEWFSKQKSTNGLLSEIFFFFKQHTLCIVPYHFTLLVTFRRKREVTSWDLGTWKLFDMLWEQAI